MCEYFQEAAMLVEGREDESYCLQTVILLSVILSHILTESNTQL